MRSSTLALPFIPSVQRVFEPDTNTQSPPDKLRELPGGSPFSLCPSSHATDLFQITSIEITKQPVYIDDDLFTHIYGEFLDTWKHNATITTTVDCGSHCEMYGQPPGKRDNSTFDLPFWEFTEIMQPLGGKKKEQWEPPEIGYALITSPIYVFPMDIRAPAWYNFTFQAFTDEGKQIYCLTAEVCLRWEDPKQNEGYPEGPWTNCTWPR